MNKLTFLVIVFGVALLIASCSPAKAATPTLETVRTQSVTAVLENGGSATLTPPVQSQPAAPQTDSQGMVTVEVTPENLQNPGDALVFDVAMNTHSVNLGMDLAKQATLMTDNDTPVPASRWDGPTTGGHHVSGKLTFPTTYNGKPVLQGATRVTVTITNVDAPARIFTWQLSQ